MTNDELYARYRDFKVGQHRRALARARHARLTGNGGGQYHAHCLHMAALVRSTLAADCGARTTYRDPVTLGRF